MKHKVSLFTLALFITGAIDSIRNLPTTALFGPSLIFFFILGAVFFLFPTGLISAELSSRFEEEGGIYAWTRKALGEKWAVLAIWLQWINTLIWYPTLLSFIGATLIYPLHLSPDLVNNKAYMISAILIVFWSVTGLNLLGLKTSLKMASFCAFFGMVLPMILILTLGATWILTHHPLAIQFSLANLLPSLSHMNNWVSLTGVMASFLGMELATVFVKDIDNAQSRFPKALLISIAIILSTMIFGSLSIAIVLPVEKITLVGGVMAAFSSFLAAYHLSFFLPILALMILIGSIGGMNSWAISPAKGLLQTAQQGYLPAFFQKQNRKGAPYVILLTQACLLSCLCLIFWLMPTVNSAYWFLTDLSTELYLLMYILLFISAIVLKGKPSTTLRPSFVIPGGKPVFYLLASFGILGTLASLGIGFIPPDGINFGSAHAYVLLFGAGLVCMVLPVLGLYAHRRFNAQHQSMKPSKATD